MVGEPKEATSLKVYFRNELNLEKGAGFNKVWQSIKRKYWHALFLVFYLILVAMFFLLEKHIVPTHWISSAIDGYIPYMPIFWIPYVFWYINIAVVIVALGLNSREEFFKTIMFIYTGMIVAMVIFILFPNGQTLRPVMTDNGFFSRLIRTSIYANDTNTNSCPSIHVLNQVAVHIGLCKSKIWGNNKVLKRFSLISTIFVCASTCFIKQHSILDVLFALVLCIPIYLFVYKTNWMSIIPKKIRVKVRKWELEELNENQII